MSGGEHEAEASLLDAARDAPRIEVDAGAKRLEQVGGARRAGRGAIAVLCHRTPGARGDERRGRGYVERASASARPGGVEQVGPIAGHVRRQLAHRAGEPGELADRLPLGAQRDQEGGDLGL